MDVMANLFVKEGAHNAGGIRCPAFRAIPQDHKPRFTINFYLSFEHGHKNDSWRFRSILSNNSAYKCVALPVSRDIVNIHSTLRLSRENNAHHHANILRCYRPPFMLL